MILNEDGFTLEQITNEDLSDGRFLVPSQITVIGPDAASGCSDLKQITFSKNLIEIEDDAFANCIHLEEADLPQGISQIRERVFLGCSNLERISIPKSVNLIRRKAFSGCTRLKDVTLPDGITCLKEEVFYGCTSLVHIIIPDTVTSMEYGAFLGCTQLERVVIPANIQFIDANALPSSIKKIVINSENPLEIARIAALLPTNLRKKVEGYVEEDVGEYLQENSSDNKVQSSTVFTNSDLHLDEKDEEIENTHPEEIELSDEVSSGEGESFDEMTLTKNDKFFLAVAKQKKHSFIMLGVIADGQPKLLARVGKVNDVAFNQEFVSAIRNGTLSRLCDEGIRHNNGKRYISYQAYDINFNQVREFLALIAEIEQEQLKNPTLVENLSTLYPDEDKAIRCYVPFSEIGDEVTFRFVALSESDNLERSSCIDANLVSKIQYLSPTNTCRHSAKNIVETVLENATNISNYFCFELNYKSKLVNGEPYQKSFYVLPVPPSRAGHSEKQFLLMKKIYERLEEIPKLDPKSSKTRKKFNALKEIYINIAGENHYNAQEILQLIDAHQKALFKRRSPCFFSRMISHNSTTERLVTSVQRQLIEEQKCQTVLR